MCYDCQRGETTTDVIEGLTPEEVGFHCFVWGGCCFWVVGFWWVFG